MSKFSEWFKKKTGVPEIDLSKLPIADKIIGQLSVAGAARLVTALPLSDFKTLRAAVEARAEREGL